MANERLILQWVTESVGCELEPARVPLRSGGSVPIDGTDVDETVLVQVFAERGPVKGAQRRRLSQDALKLITARESRPDARLIIAVVDADVARAAAQDGWLAATLAAWNVEVLLVDLAAPPVASEAEQIAEEAAQVEVEAARTEAEPAQAAEVGAEAARPSAEAAEIGAQAAEPEAEAPEIGAQAAEPAAVQPVPIDLPVRPVRQLPTPPPPSSGRFFRRRRARLSKNPADYR